MAIIGKFSKEKTGFSGSIETLTCAAAAVTITPIAKANPQAPDYRVYRGASEIGAAWTKTARGGHSFLVVTLDDPAFAQPIQTRLVKSADAYVLIWSRS